MKKASGEADEHKKMTSIPSSLSLDDSSIETLSSVNDIEYMLRICRSTGPKEILIKLAVNRHLLLLQISAIRIQSLTRKYLAKMKYLTIKRHVAFFQKITEGFKDLIVEEVVLSMAFEISLTFMKTYRKYLRVNETVEEVVKTQANQIVNEVVTKFAYESVIEILTTTADTFVIIQKYGSLENYRRILAENEEKARIKKNPLLASVFSLLEGVSDSFLRGIVIECIEEEVTEYLLNNYSEFVYDHLVSSVLKESVIEVGIHCLDEVSVLHPEVLSMIEDLRQRKTVVQEEEKKKDEEMRRKSRPATALPVVEENPMTLSQQIASLFVKNVFSSLVSR
jgi:hypothetical protein